ncbi:hypothetical protein MRY87_12795 [bacterium]|nr:hypothetical protein [bacterium]
MSTSHEIAAPVKEPVNPKAPIAPPARPKKSPRRQLPADPAPRRAKPDPDVSPRPTSVPTPVRRPRCEGNSISDLKVPSSVDFEWRD